MPDRMRRSGYTLIEVLAVVAIAGLVAAAITPALVRVATSDPLSRAVHQVREADRLARQQAVGLGGFWSVADERVVSGIAGWHVSDDRLPSHCAVVFQRADDGSPLERMTFDRAGCSGDVLVQITVTDQVRRFRILGLSGAWIADTAGATP
jgi:prepilin-type N-terminal cleavage/methylation domain-containing protein